jgi:hypothetical protein
LIAVTVAAFAFGKRAGGMRDFEVYWTAAGRAAAAAPLYRAEDGHFQFKYLPAFAVLAAPLSWLPLETAKSSWFVISVILIVVLLRMSLRLLPRVRRPAWVLVVTTVVAMAKFFGHEVVLGQVNVLFAATVVGGLLLIRRGSIVLAALALIAAVVIKPYALLFLPWLVVLGGARAALSAAAGLAGVLALPAAVYGSAGSIDLHRQWWQTVTESTAPNLTSADNVSVAAFFAKWMGAGAESGAAAWVVCGALLAAAALAVWRGQGLARREALEGSLLLTLIPMLSPQGWDYVFLVSTPAVMLLVNDDDRLPLPLRVAAWLAIATIGLSLYDLMGRQRYAAFMSWSIITLCYVVVVAALVTLRLRRAA